VQILLNLPEDVLLKLIRVHVWITGLDHLTEVLSPVVDIMNQFWPQYFQMSFIILNIKIKKFNP
jgi:hypothetical protein